MNDLTPMTRSPISVLERQVNAKCDPAVAARFVKQVLAMFPGQRDRDPEIEDLYVTGLVAVFSEWPQWVVEQAADPRKGLASKYTFRPVPAEVQKFCNELMTPVHRDLRNARVAAEMRSRREHPEPSPEDKAAVAKMLAEYRREQAEKETVERDNAGRDLFRRTQCAPGEAIREYLD